MRRHRLPQRVIRGVQVARHLHVRNVQRVTDFVEPKGLAILRQRIAHLQPGRVQQIAQRILVLVAIEPPPRSAAFLRNARLLGRGERRCQRFEELFRLPRVGTRFLFRRHFTGRHAVVHQDPFGKVGRIHELKFQCREIQIPLLRLRVVALDAMFLQERSHVGASAVAPRHEPGQRCAETD